MGDVASLLTGNVSLFNAVLLDFIVEGDGEASGKSVVDAFDAALKRNMLEARKSITIIANALRFLKKGTTTLVFLEDKKNHSRQVLNKQKNKLLPENNAVCSGIFMFLF
jgi:hypothetical protein